MGGFDDEFNIKVVFDAQVGVENVEGLVDYDSGYGYDEDGGYSFDEDNCYDMSEIVELRSRVRVDLVPSPDITVQKRKMIVNRHPGGILRTKLRRSS